MVLKGGTMKRAAWILISVLVLVSIFAVLPTSVVAQESYPNKVYLPVIYRAPEPYKLDGLGFSPYMAGQSPALGTQISEAQIRERLAIVAPYTKWVRTFGCGDGLEVIGRVAHEMGLKVAIGAWIGRDFSSNLDQIGCAKYQAILGNADMIIIGSEALLRDDIAYDNLISFIRDAQAEVPSNVVVTYADVYGTFLNYPGLADEVDVIFANIYPFWEGKSVEEAVALTDSSYNLLTTSFPGKTVYISEAGWPSCGTYGDSVGSVENEALYFNQLISWEKENDVTVFYFDAFDEDWKTVDEGPQGACWGLWNRDGVMKEGMKPVFDGYSVPYTLYPHLTCGTDVQSIDFTYVPPIGSHELVTGKACGVNYLDYRVVMWIYVGGGWWIKPYANQTLSPIGPDGKWAIDYTTGGIDDQATIIRVHLVPKDADPYGDLSSYPTVIVNR